MSIFTRDLALPPNLQDFCRIRIEVLEQVAQAYDTLEAADQKFKQLYEYGLSYETKPRMNLEEVCRYIDRTLWRVAFDLTGFSQVMDKQARQEFEKSLDANPPEFNEDNIRAQFLTANQEADKMFVRGLVNVFRRLSSGYVTNRKEPFKVADKVILTSICRTAFGRGNGIEVTYSSYGRDELNDIDRIIKTLDGKKYTPRGLEVQLNAAFKDGNLFEDDYYKARGFHNGNLHLWFKRQDLLDKANRIIGRYYQDQALAADDPRRHSHAQH